MKRLVCLAIAILVNTVSAKAQKEVLSNIPLSGKTPEVFIPKGYEMMDEGRAEGDLNKDGRADIVLALRNPQTERLNSDSKRLLIVLLKTIDGYRLAGKSLKVLLCHECGGVHGDPFAAVAVTNGVLTVDHYGGSSWKWTTTEKFRFQNDHLYRIGTTTDYYWSLEDCNGKGIGDAGRRYKDTNWITGQEDIIERTDDCKLIKNIKHKIKVRPLVRLEDYVNKD